MENDNIQAEPQERYVAAIEISSSKIIGAVGRTHGHGDLTVIAVEQEHGVECVRYGRIQNVEEAYLRLQRIVDKLERRSGVAPRKIDSFFVGLAGRTMRNITTKVNRTLPDDTEITQEMLRSMRDEALSQAVDSSLEIVDAVPRTFYVNNAEAKNPVGMIGSSIRATYDLIVCSHVLKRNIERVVHDKLGRDIAAFVVTPLAVGHLILSDDERRLGCMLVDMGAETTTVSIYRSGALQYLATIPLGSRNITRDITTLNVLEEHAEEIKITSGNALATDTPSTISINNNIKLQDVNNLVSARAEEIVANINEQINYAALSDEELPRGIVVVGGGSKLNGLIELLERQSNLSVRRGKLPAYVDLQDSKAPSTETIELVSVMYAGATLSNKECTRMPEKPAIPATGPEPEPEPKPKPKPKTGGFGAGWRKFTERTEKLLSGMFNPGEEDQDDSELD